MLKLVSDRTRAAFPFKDTVNIFALEKKFFFFRSLCYEKSFFSVYEHKTTSSVRNARNIGYSSVSADQKNNPMRPHLLILSFAMAYGCHISNILAENESKLLKKSVELKKAKEIRTDINFFAGDLTIEASDNPLAECVYGNNDCIRPEISYSEVGSIGYLSIESEKKGFRVNESDNQWKIFLNRKIKNEVTIRLRAGEAHIQLDECNISRFTYTMTAGQSFVNLKNSSVSDIQFHLLAGEARIDLSGKWNNSGTASIKGGIGEVTVIVPKETGVRISVSGGLGEVNIPFFHKENNVYVNDLFQKTKHTLYLNISGGIGQINVVMEK